MPWVWFRIDLEYPLDMWSSLVFGRFEDYHSCRICEPEKLCSIYSIRCITKSNDETLFFFLSYFFKKLSEIGLVQSDVSGQRFLSLLKNKILLYMLHIHYHTNFMQDRTSPNVTIVLQKSWKIILSHNIAKPLLSLSLRFPDLNPFEFCL